MKSEGTKRTTDMPETSVHTAGPWKLGNGDIFAEGNKGSDFDDRVICAIGLSGGFRSHEYVAIRAHKPEGKANARLIVAACNSYDRHFGPHAVSAAEGDLLGKALEALRELQRNNRQNVTGAEARKTWVKVETILSQAREVMEA